MTERDALLAAILSPPKDDTPRMIYADWLEDRGEVERAEFIRVQCELARIGSPKCNQPEKCYYANACEHGCGGARRDELIYRERVLWMSETARIAPLFPDIFKNVMRFACPTASNAQHSLTWSRGFISSVTLSWSDFLRHHAALIWSPRQTVSTCISVIADNNQQAQHYIREARIGNWVYGHSLSGFIGRERGIVYWVGSRSDTRLANELKKLGFDVRAVDSLEGTGRIPRPFVNTAQPIETVRLTTWPGNQHAANSIQITDADGDLIGQVMHRQLCNGRSLNRWECEAWPGVQFVMPEENGYAAMRNEAIRQVADRFGVPPHLYGVPR